MTSSGPSDRNPVERQWQDLALEQTDDRGQRPNPAQGRGRITHRFGPRQLEDRRPDELRQHLGGRPARPVDRREVELAPAGVADLAFLDRGDPGRAQKAFDCRRRRPDAGPAPLLERSGCPAGIPSAMTVRRRGVTYPRISAAGISAAASLSRNSSVSSAIARRCIPAGISSDNSSSSSSPRRHIRREMARSRVRVSCDPAQPRFAACLGERSDPQDVGGAFGYADRAAGVEQIEQVARLQALVIGRQRQAVVDEPAAFLLGIGEMSDETGGVGELEIVGRELPFGAPEDLAVGDAPARAPL